MNEPTLVFDDKIFHLKGAVDFSTLMDVCRSGMTLMHRVPQVVLDLEGLTRCNSAVLALLLAWYRYCEVEGKALVILNLPEDLHEMAKLTGISAVLPLL